MIFATCDTTLFWSYSNAKNWIYVVTDDFLDDALRQVAFRNIVRFWVEETGNAAFTMRIVELLLHHCDFLREIGLLKSWRLISMFEHSDLIMRIRIMSTDLLIRTSFDTEFFRTIYGDM
jgi:hypothetical protein